MKDPMQPAKILLALLLIVFFGSLGLVIYLHIFHWSQNPR